MAGAWLQIVEFETQADCVDPIPEQGPSLPVKVGQESVVPLNPAQVEGPLHPLFPVQTQPLFHVVQAALEVAVVLASQVLAIQAVVKVAPEKLLQRQSEPPVNF